MQVAIEPIFTKTKMALIWWLKNISGIDEIKGNPCPKIVLLINPSVMSSTPSNVHVCVLNA